MEKHFASICESPIWVSVSNEAEHTHMTITKYISTFIHTVVLIKGSCRGVFGKSRLHILFALHANHVVAVRSPVVRRTMLDLHAHQGLQCAHSPLLAHLDQDGKCYHAFLFCFVCS